MGKYDAFYKARNKIVEIVSEDLIGPVFKDEVINEYPTSYYIMGKLYPLINGDEDVDDSNTTSTDLESLEGISLSATNVKEPSAMGITFTVDKSIQTIKCIVKYAFYSAFTIEEANNKGLDLSRYEESIKNKSEKELKRLIFWKRSENEKECFISVVQNSQVEIDNLIYLKTFVHLETEDGKKVITSVLTNENSIDADDRELKAKLTVMQPEIILMANDNEETFCEIRRQVELSENAELSELEMLYSENKCYAQGHGCSVIWDIEHKSPKYLKTSFMPTYNLHQMKARQIQGTPVFNMQYLYTGNRAEVISELKSFSEKYEEWIKGQEELSQTDEYKEYESSVIDNISKCKNIENRINHAIEILVSNDIAWDSFRYANEAMYLQRFRSIQKKNEANGIEKEINSNNINWYPFQLAFILLEIASFVEPESDERRIVDLLWFPTGGGKTEAYLGIAAFVIFYRRLSCPNRCNGLNVIMRYTLRLLTIQQFERASILICACELMRKKYSLPGGEISIGLWVGNNFTPGTIDEADRVLNKLAVAGQISNDDADPCQIKICPWCGAKMYPQNYRVNITKKRMEIKCNNPRCDYHNISLPIRIIDEEIYEYRPTFLVATVDKFAQIAIQAKTSALFSIDNENLPPELIIQDELHLISGPLGTMTGIYEAAITNICEEHNRPIKVVASTATIRNATKQILSLYGRDYNQFPPQGLSSNDSFFAILAKDEERPARYYAGIMGVGTTFTTTLIRLYAAWLYASRYLIDLGYDDEVIDNYWTLTGYFNSIRELGATQSQIVDDVQSRYNFLKESKFATKYKDFSGKGKYENSVELTSRLSNADISEVIQEKLKVPYKKEDNKEVYDFLLASNMISVGVDVGRLGTMAVAGQSKTNAEYIQATSRVGRDNPGLVFTVYNGSRSRDRSHYEQFSKYHAALYRYVEATSLTPFSDRARDRGLQALFVILCRYYCNELLADNAAGNFRPDLDGVKRAERVIYNYVCKVDAREKDNVLAELRDIKNQWYEMAQGGELWYRKKGKKSLLRMDTDEDRFRIMNSMRTVERESGVYLLGVD